MANIFENVNILGKQLACNEKEKRDEAIKKLSKAIRSKMNSGEQYFCVTENLLII